MHDHLHIVAGPHHRPAPSVARQCYRTAQFNRVRPPLERSAFDLDVHMTVRVRPPELNHSAPDGDRVVCGVGGRGTVMRECRRRSAERERDTPRRHPRAGAQWLRYFGSSIFTAFNVADVVGGGVLPAGYLLTLRTYAITSAYWSGFSVPGAFDGMSIEILSISSPAVMPFQPLMKSFPESAGPPVLVPSSLSPWQVAQLSA